MNVKVPKIFAVGLFLSAISALTGCLSDVRPSDSPRGQDVAVVSLRLGIAPVASALSKSAVIRLKKCRRLVCL